MPAEAVAAADEVDVPALDFVVVDEGDADLVEEEEFCVVDVAAEPLLLVEMVVNELVVALVILEEP